MASLEGARWSVAAGWEASVAATGGEAARVAVKWAAAMATATRAVRVAVRVEAVRVGGSREAATSGASVVAEESSRHRARVAMAVVEIQVARRVAALERVEDSDGAAEAAARAASLGVSQAMVVVREVVMEGSTATEAAMGSAAAMAVQEGTRRPAQCAARTARTWRMPDPHPRPPTRALPPPEPPRHCLPCT